MYVVAMMLWAVGLVLGEVPLKTKELTPDAAFPLWKQHHPLVFTVDGKLYDDHLIKENLSKKQATDLAVERYKKNKTMKSTLVGIDERTLVNKARGAQMKATVHLGGQQLTVRVTLDSYTVTLTEVTKTQAANESNCVTVKLGADGREVHHLHVDCSGTNHAPFCIAGPWDPTTGKVALFHYSSNGTLPGSNAMTNKFLVWFVDASGRPTVPKADK